MAYIYYKNKLRKVVDVMDNSTVRKHEKNTTLLVEGDKLGYVFKISAYRNKNVNEPESERTYNDKVFGARIRFLRDKKRKQKGVASYIESQKKNVDPEALNTFFNGLKKTVDERNKDPYKFDKKELNETVNMIKAVKKVTSKVVLLKGDKNQTNFNAKTNTLYVHPTDIRRYTKLKDLIR
ncbi:hypothetical protein JV173_03300 [Acholeplasma equirhinis]|uniref:hypothetical protein n=1 Tax=Acholeplasma equirhinis TaxID=555393 RepID=UPI00197AA32B|nr:hypothetical protein [Acholeplasma equirhinis]MBN3490535.1 hypothetical protein [Acholeplasma equirhinis]